MTMKRLGCLVIFRLVSILNFLLFQWLWFRIQLFLEPDVFIDLRVIYWVPPFRGYLYGTVSVTGTRHWRAYYRRTPTVFDEKFDHAKFSSEPLLSFLSTFKVETCERGSEICCFWRGTKEGEKNLILCNHPRMGKQVYYPYIFREKNDEAPSSCPLRLHDATIQLVKKENGEKKAWARGDK
ncbi:MAG: hypothetical protein WC551_10210 [Patescibacteria group bacterium]